MISLCCTLKPDVGGLEWNSLCGYCWPCPGKAQQALVAKVVEVMGHLEIPRRLRNEVRLKR